MTNTTAIIDDIDKIAHPVKQPTEYMDDDATLRLVREVRLSALDKLTENGIPVDPDGFELLHKNLQELSKDAVKGKQLKAEEKSADMIMTLAKAASEELATKMGIGMFMSQQPVEPRNLEKDLEVIEGVATPAIGELETGVDVRTYNEFAGTVGAELDRKRREG